MTQTMASMHVDRMEKNLQARLVAGMPADQMRGNYGETGVRFIVTPKNPVGEAIR